MWALPYIALMTGMRRGEILALQWKDVDFEKNMIHVTKSIAYEGNAPVVKNTKTKSGQRVVPLLNELKDYFLTIEPRPAKNYIISDDGKIDTGILHCIPVNGTLVFGHINAECDLFVLLCDTLGLSLTPGQREQKHHSGTKGNYPVET